MSYETILVETRGRVGLVRLNRPQALNALNNALFGELSARHRGVRGRRRHRLHLAHRLRQGVRGRRRHQGDGGQVLRRRVPRATSPPTGSRSTHARKPVVAAVAGYALGGGCELAMQCDLIIAADNAHFGQPEIKLGIIPGIGGTQRLTRAVGKAKAMDLILTGRMMDAAEAERSGLVARVVPAASLMDEAMKVADTIASMSLPSVMAAKEAVNRAFETLAGRRRAVRAPRLPRAVCDRRPEGRHGGVRGKAAAEVQQSITADTRARNLPDTEPAHACGQIARTHGGSAADATRAVRSDVLAFLSRCASSRDRLPRSPISPASTHGRANPFACTAR